MNIFNDYVVMTNAITQATEVINNLNAENAQLRAALAIERRQREEAHDRLNAIRTVLGWLR